MEAASSAALSRKEYLKKYIDNPNPVNDDKKKKKKKKKKTTQSDKLGVLVVDEDPVWAKPLKTQQEQDDDSADEEKPQIEEDIEVKRMKRMELIRARNAASVDGSGWVVVSDVRVKQEPDLSPIRRKRDRSHSPEDISPLRRNRLNSEDNEDISPPRRNRPNVESVLEDISPPRRNRPNVEKIESVSEDISPPRRNRLQSYNSGNVSEDLSPPRRNRPHPEKDDELDADLSPPRRNRSREDMSPPRRNRPHSRRADDLVADMSPPRRNRPHAQKTDDSTEDISPPRRRRPQAERVDASVDDLSPPRKISRVSPSADLSPPRKNRGSSKEEARTGLLTAKEIKLEIERKKKEELMMYKEMDPSMSGRGAEPVYRDKAGKRMTKEEVLKSQKGEEKPKEKKLEWGKGLAQQREAEARERELELERERPFARTRDDPELDKMLKERVRWGDPMAHLVKSKHQDFILEDFGENEKMKESGFIIPQKIPNHSWIIRKIDAPANRYGIKPGRHWDGVDRSNGSEKDFFKRSNEKQANEKEAYLWSVSDM